MVSNEITLPAGGCGLEWGIDSMTKDEAVKIFNRQRVRTHWDEETEKWYFSIVDVVAILTDSADARKYWSKLKQRLKAEGNETVTNCHQLKMLAIDGKMRLTDVADTFEQNQEIARRSDKVAGVFADRIIFLEIGRVSC